MIPSLWREKLYTVVIPLIRVTSSSWILCIDKIPVFVEVSVFHHPFVFECRSLRHWLCGILHLKITNVLIP
jgi:hypothetical protein